MANKTIESKPARKAAKISVLLVDDHNLVRLGFRRILEDEPDIQVVAEASNGDDAVSLARKLRPDVIIMDCALPGLSGLAATKTILQEFPKTRWFGKQSMPARAVTS